MLEWVMGLWFHTPHAPGNETYQTNFFRPRVGKYIAVIHRGIHTLIKWDSPFTDSVLDYIYHLESDC